MSDGATTAALSGTPTKERFLGVDVARGVALLSMLAANVFDNLDDNGEPTLAVMTWTGRAGEYVREGGGHQPGVHHRGPESGARRRSSGGCRGPRRPGSVDRSHWS